MKYSMKLSIIIPTKNEEALLPRLLQSILTQELDFDYEIIVSDAYSIDRTREIALNLWCILCDWWIPAVWRNNWAKISRWEYLLFLDADWILKQWSIDKWINQLKNTDSDLGLPFLELESQEDNIFARMYFYSSIIWYRIWCAFWAGLIFKKSLFRKIWWFNENIYLLEDVEIVKRARKYTKKSYLLPKIQTSARRFDKIWTVRVLFFTTYLFLLSWFGIYKTKNKTTFNTYKL